MSHSSSHLKIVPDDGKVRTHPKVKRTSIGQILMSHKWVTESDLLKAWHIQRYEDAAIGEILVGMGKLSIDQLYWALGMQYGLDVVGFERLPPSMNWTRFTDAQTSLQKGYIAWRNTDSTITFAVTDPNKIDAVRSTYQDTKNYVDFILVKPSCLQRFIATTQSNVLQEEALVCCPKSLSCRSWALRAKSNTWGLAILISLIATVVMAPMIALSAALTFVLIALVLLMGFRISFLIILRKKTDIPHVANDPLKITKRPKVSMLVPLFKEGAILERLVTRLQTLAYPKELLEICFIYEQNDQETKNALEAMDLPKFMKSIEVPHGRLQTKPRAMNYALDFCSGSIIGVYDAEDAPESNQIEQVVQKFENSDDNIACIQCVLDFYNANTNWISRCFTVEYAILFRVILPALDKLGLPIPLGGTSVFFRREILEKLGRWDAFNVTEDADLGYRLYRLGYRCSWINTVTYEEANYRMIPWIKQRSRWLKGFFLTALVHLKNPIKLQKEIGIPAMLSMLSLTVVPWIICPLAPVILPMWFFCFGIDLPFYSDLPNWFKNTLVITFITTEIMSAFLGYIATKSQHHKSLRPWILTTLFYWPITCLASYKALFEVFVRPAYWDKSEHGLNDRQYEQEIKKLTLDRGLNLETSGAFPTSKLRQHQSSGGFQTRKTNVF